MAAVDMREFVMTPSERAEFFEHKGYLVIPDALPPDVIQRVRGAVERLSEDGPKPGQSTVNIADILGKDDAFLELIDCPRVFPKIWGILGWNIWVQHSHVVVVPPAEATSAAQDAAKPFRYGWHRDGGAINRDTRVSAPLLIKVGFYLSDVSMEGGPTLIVEDADPNARIPDSAELPDNIRPLAVKAGTAVIFSNRSIHSLKSPNKTGETRWTVFIQYGYRWIQSLDRCTVEHLSERVDGVRRQLLGLTTTYTDERYKGSEGRSGRLVPSGDDVPLFFFIRDLLGEDADRYVARSVADSELRSNIY